MANGIVGTLVLTGVLAVAFNNPLWTDEKGATKALENQGFTADQGYSQVTVGGYSLFGCDTVDATKFTATKKDGSKVDGVVCKGLVNRTSSVHTW